MDKESRWHQLGMEARRAGRTHGDNPLLLPATASLVSSERRLWRAQLDAWWEGWEAEDQRLKQRPTRNDGDAMSNGA
jgi:hypothetical protein